MTVALRWCKCGHVEGIHWGGDEVEEALVEHPLPFQCHAKDCDCTEFRPKKLNRIKHFLTGRA
jgi:hypothetical protein